jgi:cystinosin
MPKNQDLPTVWYQSLSSIIGYSYFLSWSVSFYPQLITNYQQKSIEGLSTDSYVLAVVNYTCYTIYNTFFFFSKGIRQEYQDRHGQDSKITVQSNDVAFAIHALILNCILMYQIAYYGGFQSQPISKVTIIIVIGTILVSLGYIACIYLLEGFLWIDFLYLMATIKLVLTILTYLPQILLNFQRKSTQGWNLWNVIFDCTGGVLSLLQLVWDSVDLDDVKHGLLGNVPKLILSFITLACDVSSNLIFSFVLEISSFAILTSCLFA